MDWIVEWGQLYKVCAAFPTIVSCHVSAFLAGRQAVGRVWTPPNSRLLRSTSVLLHWLPVLFQLYQRICQCTEVSLLTVSIFQIKFTVKVTVQDTFKSSLSVPPGKTEPNFIHPSFIFIVQVCWTEDIFSVRERAWLLWGQVCFYILDFVV